MGLGNDFFDMSPKAQATKAKMSKWCSIKLKSFYTLKEISNKIKRQTSEWEKIFTNCISDMELMSKIYKEPIKLNSKRKNIQKKMGRELEEISPKKIEKWPKGT